jgi:hypothetical protein
MTDPAGRDHPQSAAFHSGLYKLIVLLGALFVAAAWGFAGRGITDMLLVVVSGFFFVSMGLVALLWLTRRRHLRDDWGDRECRFDSFGNWVCRDVETSTGRMRGSIATIEALLPVAAVAIGMVAFAVVVHFAGHA